MTGARAIVQRSHDIGYSTHPYDRVGIVGVNSLHVTSHLQRATDSSSNHT